MTFSKKIVKNLKKIKKMENFRKMENSEATVSSLLGAQSHGSLPPRELDLTESEKS